MSACHRLQPQMAEAGEDSSLHHGAVLRQCQRANGAPDRWQPLIVDEGPERQLRRLDVAAVTQPGENVREECPRFPLRRETALPPLDSLALLVFGLVVDGAPRVASFPDMSSYRFASSFDGRYALTASRYSGGISSSGC